MFLRLTPAAGYLPRRTHFLDGAFSAYFGPGQDQTAVRDTLPPTDWPAAGALLRPPQVVWLSQMDHASPFDSGVYIEGVIHVTRIRDLGYSDTYPDYDLFSEYWVSYNSAAMRDDFTATVTQTFPSAPPGEDPVSMQWHVTGTVIDEASYSTPMPAEQARIAGVFAAVKARIEAIRPGKTWVETYVWNPAFPDEPNFYGTDIPNFLTTPLPPEPGTFLGTDFLHVATTETTAFGGSSVDGSSGMDYAGQWVPPIFATNVRGFARFAIRLYHPNPDLWPDLSYIVEPGRGPILTFAGVSRAEYLGSGENFDHIVESCFADGMPDIAHPGSAALLQEEYLVGLIAAHFGFDPATGKDL